MAQQSDSKATEPDITSAGEPMVTSSVEGTETEASLEMAAPYGTRSRNRTGSSRPNYAEDKDYDVEMHDYDHERTHGDSKKASRQSNAATHGEGSRSNASSRKASADDARTGPSQNGSKEQTPAGATGASLGTQMLSSTTQPSRKRKAATVAQQANSNAAAVSTRRAGAGAGVQNAIASSWPETNMLTFTNCRARPQSGRLVADDGTVLEANDHVYLVCEPPGEPYYLGRIMEFLHPQNDSSRPVDAVRINWFYRPRDIGRKVHDTRVVFATMHSDISPLTALRGKCQIRHRVEITNMEEYRRTPDSFWFEKLYDRYIQKNYDLIPTSSIVNVPDKVKKVLDERWKFVLVEQGRGKELTSAVKLCKRCSGYCASNDSVDCAVCQNTYHMNCVRPPLLKKPSRGFAWSCAACSRAQERKLEARHTSNQSDPYGEADEDELPEEDDDDLQGAETGRSSPVGDEEAHHQGTAEQIYNASLWPWRYLGMHCKPEDALDYDDRIYPRASTRIGPRHQAPVGPWPGRPVHYVKPPDKKKGKNHAKAAEEAQAAELYPDGKRPKWVQDTPPGYVARGEDPVGKDDPNATATLLWKPPASEDVAQDVDSFMKGARGMAKALGLPERSTNLQDVALETLFRKDYDSEKAVTALSATDKAKFKEPTLNPAEQKKFEEAVSKHGSELHLVMKHVKTMTPGQVVRYYYTWKKTERGQSVRSNYSGRKGRKESKRAEVAATKLADDVADDEDDSAFDSAKAGEKKRAFMCQFCSGTTSRRWRRAPNAAPGLVNENGVKATSKDKGSQYVVALCTRCAELWRRYAIRWEDIDEMSKKVGQAGKAWKRKQDEELLKELQAANDRGLLTPDRPATPLNGAASGSGQEPPRKKIKGADRDLDSDGGSGSGPWRTKKDKTSDVPVVPELPKPRTLPCAICDNIEPTGDHLSCRECRLTVHRNCYGVVDNRGVGKWTCDMCVNDKNPQVSTNYKCVLCPVEHTEHELIEQPKLTHHKKKMSEKDRERERLEVQQARKALELYRKKQEELNRPLSPREPLKRTADNNWVHVTCAVFTPEVKFGNAKALEPSEGIPSIARSKYDEACHACNEKGGACVSCLTCRTPFHVECARRQGHLLCFDVIPVKSSRRDQAHIVTVKGESGVMAPGLWCKDHIPTKTVMHKMHDQVDESGTNAIQFYVQNYKQADHTLTGTVRKANLMATAAKMSGTAIQAGLRRLSTTALPNGGAGQSRNGDSTDTASEALHPGEKVCICCGIDVSPRWWQIDSSRDQATPFHTMLGKNMGEEAEKFVSQRNFQCHKCRMARLPPKPPSPKPRFPRSSSSWSSFDPPPLTSLPDSGIAATASASASALRSPERPSLEHRDGRHPHNGWPPQPPSIHSVVQPVQAPPSQTHANGPRPAPGPHAYSPASTHSSAPALASAPQPIQAPPAAPYSDWGHRPTSQHGSPPRHLNSGPPSLPNGPPRSSVSSLRPPNAISGPPPASAGPASHHNVSAHGHSPYMNGLPPSPRRASGPAPPSPYAASYHPGPGHSATQPPPAPPHHVGPHGLSNGVPPPRHEAYPQALPPRAPFAGSQGSPPLGSRAGLPHTREPSSTPPTGPNASRNGIEARPTSGASANPSLRNLLS